MIFHLFALTSTCGPLDLQLHCCLTLFNTRLAGGAGVVATIRQLKIFQSEAEVSSFQSISIHGRSPAVMLVLVLKLVTFLFTQVNCGWVEVGPAPHNCAFFHINTEKLTWQQDKLCSLLHLHT